jgi:hypothetical protein
MQRIPLKLTIETYSECPADWNADSVQFHFEEHLCISNLIAELWNRIEESEAKGLCFICSQADVEVISNDKI